MLATGGSFSKDETNPARRKAGFFFAPQGQFSHWRATPESRGVGIAPQA